MKHEAEIWIDEALVSLNYLNRKCEAFESKEVCASIKCRFIDGNPRVWWLGLKQLKNVCDVGAGITLSDLVKDPLQRGLFIPETESDAHPVYSLTSKEVETVVQECPFFEYYFFDSINDCLIAENDHNQFLIAQSNPSSSQSSSTPCNTHR